MKIAKAGFTLIELLLSTLIFSILVLSIASSFHTGVLSYNRIDSSFNTYQTARVVLNRIALDLNNSFNYPIPEKDCIFTADKQRMEFFTILDSFDEQGNTYPSIFRIIYEFDGNALRRTLLKGIDALKTDTVTQTDILAEDIKDISFEYAYSIEKDPAKAFDWQDSWPKQDTAEQKKIRPLAVKIKLSLTQSIRRQGKRTVEFNKLVSLL